jgi:hypothetical protein
MRRYLIVFFNHEKFIAQFALFIAQSEDLSLKLEIYRSIWRFIAQTRLST